MSRDESGTGESVHVATSPRSDAASVRARPGRSARVRVPRGDLLLAVAVALVGAGLAGGMAAAQGVGNAWLTATVVAAEAVPLAWRRRRPVAVLAGTGLLALVATVVPAAAFSPLLATVVATYTIAAHRRLPVALGAGAATAFGLPVVVRTLFGGDYPFYVSVVPADHLANDLAGGLFVFGGATALGAAMRARRAYTASVEQRAARLERERAERERRAVLEERARIARELHDVAAHHLSGLVLQAGALERTVERDPSEARRLAADVREGGATALASMRRLVGLLRDDEAEHGGRGSQPTLADLDGLLAQARSDGLEVRFATAGEVRATPDIPDEVGLACYRIVQEALSNTRRHAPGARAWVHLVRSNGHLKLEVTDDGGTDVDRGLPDDAAGEPGHGLIGMRERVALLGGRFEAGPARPAGWQVCAELPLDADPNG